MKTFLFLKITPLLILFLITSCDTKTNTTGKTENQGKPSAEEAREAFDSFWALFNNEDLSDSLTFNRFLSFFADDFLMTGNEGAFPDRATGLLDWLRGEVKTHKPNFDITVDKVVASEDLAYILYRYHETFTEIETGDITTDVMHSAIMILRKNEEGTWRCVFMKFT